MDSNKPQTEEKLAVNPALRVPFCQRNKSENGSFMSKLRNHFHEFINASMDEHQTCLRDTMQKMFNSSVIFGEKKGDKPNAGETPLPLQSSTRN